MKRDLESEKERRVECQTQAEKERLAASALRRELQQVKDSHQRGDSQLRSKLTELQAAIDMERKRNDEINRYGRRGKWDVFWSIIG